MLRISPLILLVTSTVFVSSLHAKEAHKCTIYDEFIKVEKTERGKKCGAADSLSVVVKNVSDQTVHIQLCLEKTSGKWDCGSSTEKPGETMGYYICHATGEYIYRGRHKNDWGKGCMPKDKETKRPLPLPQERVLR